MFKHQRGVVYTPDTSQAGTYDYRFAAFFIRNFTPPFGLIILYSSKFATVFALLQLSHLWLAHSWISVDILFQVKAPFNSIASM